MLLAVQQFACFDQDLPIAALQQFALVRHQHQRGARLVSQVKHQVCNLAPGSGIEITGGLISKQYPRPDGKGAGKGNPLLLTPGQVFDQCSGFGLQAYLAQAFDGPVIYVDDARQLHRQHDVLDRGRPLYQVKRLEHETDPAGAD